MISSYNPNASYGRALMDLVGGVVPVFGDVHVVVNTSDTSDPNYQKLQEVFQPSNGFVRFWTSLSDAYDACTTNNNDVILLDAHTSQKVTSMLTIAKNKVHFIGMDSGGRWNNARALISNTGAGAATDVSMVKVTGSGCSFRNIKFSNNWTVAQNLSAVLEYGTNSFYQNCSFHNLGSAHLTNANAAPLILATGDGEFHNCTVGADTLQSTVAAGQTMLIKKGTSSQAATRCLFEKCVFRAYTSQSTHAFVRVAADGDIDRDIGFKDCDFINFKTSSDGTTMAVAIVSASGLASGQMWFNNPNSVGATSFATAAAGDVGLHIIGPVPTTTTSGISVVPA